jgi:elongation factor G
MPGRSTARSPQPGTGSQAGDAPAAERSEEIRNVVLVGPAGSGKTTLVEALLVSAGVLSRAGSIEAGTTVTDHDDVEQRQQRSVGLAVAPLMHRGTKVNLIDTPGYADFVGEVRGGLRAADAAMFVVAANEGVDEPTKALWRECAAVGMPRAVVVTRVDHARADYDAVVTQAQQEFGEKVVPAYLVEGGRLVGLLTDDHEHDVQRGALIEAVIEESEDESLMDRYLGGEEIDRDSLLADLETAVARGTFHPVVPVDAPAQVGTRELLDLVVQGFPSPVEHPMPEVFTPAGGTGPKITCDADGPLVAEIVRTTTDPYVGRVSLVRIFSGTLRPDATVHVSGHFSAFFGEDSGHEDHDEDERIGGLAAPLGATLRTIPAAVAGDVCAVTKLTRAETGDTLSDKEVPLVLRPWTMPEPLFPVAVQARTKADEDRLGQGLQRLAAEDPSLRVEHNAETHQIVLWCMGDAHADVVLERLAGRHGAAVDQVELVVPLRETFADVANGHGRHVKQSGGHGQYAVCDITVEPLSQGSGFEFADRVVGGAVPRQFIPSVEKGVRAQMEKGVSAGYPLVDVKVTLTDGKAHSVDSSDMAFQTAGALALRDAAQGTPVNLLEPVDEVAVLVPDDLVGPVMSDLSGRRGHVLGSESVEGGRTVVRAQVPQVEITRYAVELRSFTRGAATFTRRFVRYQPMPDSVAAKYAE